MQLNNEKPVILDVFRGEEDHSGKIVATRRVGRCNFYPNSGSHVIHIDLFHANTFTFYLRPPLDAQSEMRICVKEHLAKEPGRYFYRQVGTASLCKAPNDDIVYLEWDFIGPVGIYMRTIQPSPQEVTERVSA